MVSQDGIARDLTQGQDKPIWPLSSYGPAKGEPTILEGLDESAEEMRWKALQAVRSGNIAEYVCRISNSLLLKTSKLLHS